MKTVVLLLLHHLGAWRSDRRVHAAFLLGIALCITPVSRYMAYARVMGSAVPIWEPFIYMGSTVPCLTGTFLGVLLLMSDAPFLCERSPYEILRTGKRAWIAANILYVFISCLLYMMAILAVTMLISCTAGSITLDNHWSAAMETLAEKQPDFAVITYKIKFAYPEWINSVSPVTALLQTLLYNGLYMAVISLCIFCVNLRSHINCGWLVGAAVHVVGYVIYANGPLLFPQKCSLLVCSVPAFHYAEGYGISNAYAAVLLCALAAALVFLTLRASARVEPFQKCRL